MLSETREYRGYTIEIHADEDPSSPREWDNLGTMPCFCKNMGLGDTHDYESEDFTGWGELEAHIDKDQGGAIILPLFLLDHSGITMNTTGFDCPWDSGQVGFIYVSKADVREEYGKERISKKLRDKVYRVLTTEVDIYDMYISGEVYGYMVKDEDGELLESCWGYFGEPDCECGLVYDAEAIIDYKVKTAYLQYA